MFTTFEKRFSRTNFFASRNISVPSKFTTILASPHVLPGKWCVQDYRRAKNNTANLRCS